MARDTAGLVVWRTAGRIEILLVHPLGGDARGAPWSLPKGKIDEGEDPEAAARREVREETGIVVVDPVTPLGTIEYTRANKRMHAFAVKLPEGSIARVTSPEIAKVAWFDLDRAMDLVHRDQCAFVSRLRLALEAP